MSRMGGRDQNRARLKNQATSLVLLETITTTKPHAKALVPYFEKLINKAKKQTLHAFRQVRSQVDTEVAAQKLYNELAARFEKRTSGYVSAKSVGWRQGDNAQLIKIVLTEKPAEKPKTEAKPAAKTETKPKPKLPAKKPVKAKAKVA